MAPGKFTRVNFLLDRLWKIKQCQALADIALPFAANGAYLIQGPVLRIQLAQLLESNGFLYWVQVLTLEVLNQPLGGGFPLAHGMNDLGINGRPAQPSCRSKPPLTRYKLIGVSHLSDRHRLKETLLLHGLSETLDGLLIKIL